MINVKNKRSLPRHTIYVMHFKLYSWANTDRYFLRKRDIERTETGAKPLVR